MSKIRGFLPFENPHKTVFDLIFGDGEKFHRTIKTPRHPQRGREAALSR